MMSKVTYVPIEVLVKGQPHSIVDVPVLGEVTPDAIEKAERRAFWTMAATGAGDVDEITTRHAPEYADSRV
jgi:hypothetical protein